MSSGTVLTARVNMLDDHDLIGTFLYSCSSTCLHQMASVLMTTRHRLLQSCLTSAREATSGS